MLNGAWTPTAILYARYGVIIELRVGVAVRLDDHIHNHAGLPDDADSDGFLRREVHEVVEVERPATGLKLGQADQLVAG